MHYKRTKKSINEFAFDIWAVLIFLFSCLITLALIYKCQGVSVFISDNIGALSQIGRFAFGASAFFTVFAAAKHRLRIRFLVALAVISFLIACSSFLADIIPSNILGGLAIINIYIFILLMLYFTYLLTNKRGKTAKSIIDDLIKGNENEVVELGKCIGSKGDGKDILFFNELVQETLLRSGKLLQGDDKKSAPKREELYSVQYKLCHLVVRYCITTNPGNMNTVSELFESIYTLCLECEGKHIKSTEYIKNESFEYLTAGAVAALLKYGEDNSSMEGFVRRFLHKDDTFYKPEATLVIVYTMVAAYCQLYQKRGRLNPCFKKFFAYKYEDMPYIQLEQKEDPLLITIKKIWSKEEDGVSEEERNSAIEDIKRYDGNGRGYFIKCKF